ncbi:hypothetical protein GH714_043168 [Hevea brasiliensis]|uniref:Uncharacterized protein n=1 Tax=Hevea brasiliensis TaxID=3981 RepID=A0A6A6K5U0_HEVBR|nr:hypothetical protein GH714_043168 [Hevea brasiliensis]
MEGGLIEVCRAIQLMKTVPVMIWHSYPPCIGANRQRLNDLMESKGGKKKSSSSKSLFYEAPLGYSIEDVRPHGGIKKFRTAAYSNCVRKPS